MRSVPRLSPLLFGALVFAVFPHSLRAEEPAHVRGADELFWAPTLEQALEMATATGRPLFLMGYSLVDNSTTYTKIAPDYCSGVF